MNQAERARSAGVRRQKSERSSARTETGESRVRRDGNSGAGGRAATRGVSPERGRPNDDRAGRKPPLRLAVRHANQEDGDRQVCRPGGKRRDNAPVLSVALRAVGTRPVIVGTTRRAVRTGVMPRRFRMKRDVGRRIGREPGQQADQRHAEACRRLPEQGRTPAGAGSVGTGRQHLSAEHTEVVKPPTIPWRTSCGLPSAPPGRPSPS